MSDLKAGVIAVSGVGGMLAIANLPIGVATFPVWGTVGVAALAVGGIVGLTVKNIKKNK